MKNQLKKLSFLGLLAAIAVLQSCLDSLTSVLPTVTVPWNGQSMTVTIPPTPAGQVYVDNFFSSKPADLDSLIKAKNSNMSLKNIKHITIDSCILTINNPDQKNNWRNFNQINLSILPLTGNNWDEIGQYSGSPSDTSTKTRIKILPDPNVDLIKYVNTSGGKTVFNYEIAATQFSTTNKPLIVTINAYYKITAGAN